MDYGSRFQRHQDWADDSALSGPVSKGKNHGEEKKAALLMGARDWRSQNKKEEHIISLNADLNWIHLLMSPWPPKSHQDYESTDGLTYP